MKNINEGKKGKREELNAQMLIRKKIISYSICIIWKKH